MDHLVEPATHTVPETGEVSRQVTAEALQFSQTLPTRLSIVPFCVHGSEGCQGPEGHIEPLIELGQIGRTPASHHRDGLADEAQETLELF